MSYLISNTELSPDTNYLPSVNAIAQPQTAASLSPRSSTPVVIKPSAPENLPPQYSPINKTFTPTATIKSSVSQTSDSEIQQFAAVVAPPESFAPEASLSPTIQLSDSSLQTSPEEKTKARSEAPPIKAPISEELQVFPVGLDVDQRPTIKSVLMRGLEDGMQAINFEQWLIPYEAVVRALQLNVTTLADGQLEIRAPGLVTRINL